MIKKSNIYRVLFVVGLFSVFMLSCGGDSSNDGFNGPDTPNYITPSNLKLEITVIGADVNNPNGDGTGKIECIVTADDATKFEYIFFNDDEIASIDGKESFTFIDKGTNNFIIKVTAFSKDNRSISLSKGVMVYVNDDMQLVWSDEFDVEGAPDANKWNYNIGTGSGGWGNNESQYYTDRSENVSVKDGVLKITAKKEEYSGSQFTSTRMLSQDKFEFTYAKVEVRAKLPSGGGTWPAIWMLGANIGTAGWPACGEIDIMEHIGNNQGVVSSALHTPSSNGNTINKGEKLIPSASSEFHVYAVDWMPKKMVFSIDGVPFYIYGPGSKNMDNWPYTEDQFIILNVAMGGSFGGNIDPNFTESSMEIDYVRVYQK